MKKSLGAIRRGLYGWYHTIFDTCPPINSDVPIVSLGRTSQDRELSCYTLGAGKTSVLLVGGTHGNEVGTVKLVHRLINYLWENREDFSGLTIYAIPCLNPDGYAEALKQPDFWSGGRLGRFNARGVDLNRNFDTPDFQSESDWNHGKNYQETTRVFAGDKPFSEIETAALRKLITDKNIAVYYAFHSAGRDVMPNALPLSGELAKIFSQLTGYRLVDEGEWKELKQTGTAKQWTQLNKIAYVEIEAACRWGSDWAGQRLGILESLKALPQIVSTVKGAV